MINNKLVIGITQGDSNGIGYEVIIKALADARILDAFTPVIYGSSKLFGLYRKQLHNIEQMDTYVVSSAAEAKIKKINIVNCLPENVNAEPGKATAESARAAICALDHAVEDLKNKSIDALVTAPINKRAMQEAGFQYTGHTEYLEAQFGGREAAMIMISNSLKVGVVTGHIPLKDVSSSISTEKILGKIRLMKESLQRDFGIIEPKIAVLGLNPHCGDGGLLGDEEQEIILPAIKAAHSEGILAYGPYSADGFFSLGNYSKFDATLAMYHDQGLAPFKALSFETGVNFSAGLPVIRTSPDHGTADDMAGRDMADPQSMSSAIYSAIDIYRNRARYAAIRANKMQEREIEEPKNGRPQIV